MMTRLCDTHIELFGDTGSAGIAMKLIAAGFGVVPGTGFNQDGRIMTRRGAMSSPLYDMDAVRVLSEADDDMPYYVALAQIGHGEDMLTVIDVDNGHGNAASIPSDELWERVVSWLTGLGCPEASETIVVETPHEGFHIYFRSGIAPLFKWAAGLRCSELGDDIAVDWLTPGGHQHATGPGCIRPGAGRYRLMVPMSSAGDLSNAIAEMPEQLLRWLVVRHVAARHGDASRCFRSDIGLRRARKLPALADILTAPRRSETKPAAPAAGSSLWRDADIAESGRRHVAAIEFAGRAESRMVGRDFAETRTLIEEEVRAFCSERCSPPLPSSEVDGIVRDALTWADRDRDKIEARCASRVVAVMPDGTEQAHVIQDWVGRRVHGATYRCRPRRNGAPGVPISTPANVVEALEHDEGLAGRFGYDAMACRACVVKPLPWSSQNEAFPRFLTDADIGRIITYIDEVAGFDPTRPFASALSDVCSRHAFDPLQDFVRGFADRWDGRDHMDLLSRYMGAEDDLDDEGRSFSAACLTLWMRGAIRRALKPGCKFDYVLILTGEQGVGKSTFWQMMATRDDWMCESLTDIRDSKKCFEQISASWLVCIDELAALRSARDVARIKTYLSARFDDYRAPYKREQERVQRHCVFCGTTNELSFLSDRSGNRRFLLVPCSGVMDDDGRPAFFSDPEFRAEIEQAWAQAYAIEAAAPDEPLVLPRWAMATQEARNADASVSDPVEEAMERAFAECRLSDEPMSYSQLYARAYGVPEESYLTEKHLKSFQDLARRVARRSGWEEGRFRSTWGRPGGQREQRRGFRPILSDEERAAARRLAEVSADDDTLVDMGQLTLVSGGA